MSTDLASTPASTPDAIALRRFDFERLGRVHLLHVSVPANIAPPKGRCGDRAVHDRHQHEGREGLIWSCPGRRGSTR